MLARTVPIVVTLNDGPGRYEKFIIGVGIDHNIPVYYRYGPGNSVNNQRTNRF